MFIPKPSHLLLKKHSGRKDYKNIIAGRWGEGRWNTIFHTWHSPCNCDFIAAAAACFGPTKHWDYQRSIMDWDGSHGALNLPSELLATDGFRGKGRHCLSSLMSLDVLIRNSRFMITQMMLITFIKLQNIKDKNNRKRLVRRKGK